ncbi:hypothetical protein CPC08DRAFT_822591 [Agrocybe pediades]|nr:hypothetical protein CPC08DRAFT_822591 [Agrocybe pediades]
MASIARRNNLQSRLPSRSAKSTLKAADQLASDLSSKLNLGNDKGKARAPEIEDSSFSMRSVNEASQALSGVVQSGWKRSSSDSRTTLSTVAAITAKATKHLDVLRRLRPRDMDVERAAMSILSKIVTLEMYESAGTALKVMQPRLIDLLGVEGPVNDILSMPEPPSPPTDAILLNLISLYLLYAITIQSQAIDKLEELSLGITAPSTRSLLSWMPALSVLPSKHIDSLLTRTYSALNKLCSSKPKTSPSPSSIFKLRTYALRCLAHTSPGTIEASHFWNQAARFSAAFVKSTPAKGEEQTTSMILHAYSELVNLAEQRSDRDSFLAIDEKGDGFTTFCEHWTVFAKRAGDISTLQRINAYIVQPSSSTSGSVHQPSKGVSASERPQPVSSKGNTSQGKDLLIQGTRIYNVLSQALVTVESSKSSESELQQSIEDCSSLLKQEVSLIASFLVPSQPQTDKPSREEEQLLRISSKVDRALDKLRRTFIKLFESRAASTLSPRSKDTIHSSLIQLLTHVVDCLQSTLAFPDLDSTYVKDTITRSLETLFSLAKTGLDLNDPPTMVTSFDQLKQAAAILDSVSPETCSRSTDEQPVDLANYTRCVSGAFYNIAGTLYQSFRYGNAVPFLIESCLLGAKALAMPRIVSNPRNETREKEWSQLEEQLFRRWELLAVCYSKNGDRRNAYDAFKQAIHTFPFVSSGVLAQCDSQSCDAIFGPSCSPPVKQLVGLVDRLSYLGACELLLDPAEVSILSSATSFQAYETSHGHANVCLDPAIAGLLLERQLDSLESSRWKDAMRAVFIRLLQDSLKVFDAKAEDGQAVMPVRRARTLVRCLEFLYRDSVVDGCRALGFGGVEDIADEVEVLCGQENSGKDIKLSHFIPQLRVSAHLWAALHAHRRADEQQTTIIARRSEEACAIMKDMLSSSHVKVEAAPRKSNTPKAAKIISSRIVSPRQTRATRQRLIPPPAPKKAPPTRTRAAAGASAANPVTPKPRARVALQSGGAVVHQTPPRPPRPSNEGASTAKAPAALVFDNFDKFMSLLQLTSIILGFLSLTLPKARLLEMARKIAQRHSRSTSDGYVLASLDLAHEYVVLGKLKRASSIFYPALDIVRSGKASNDVAVRFLLRFSEAMALMDDAPKSYEIYLEALEFSNLVDLEQTASSTQQRICARAKVLELAALAAHTFGSIQYTKGEICASLDGLLQSLRLWNRAVETLTRLKPSTSPEPESDPFEMSSLKDALPSSSSNKPATDSSPSKSKSEVHHRPYADGLEWRISEGLLSTMFALAQAYYLRGSAREAEYFAKQAADLAAQLNTPGMLSRALAKHGEIQLHLGQIEQAQANLGRAAALLADIPGLDKVEIRRLEAEVNAKTAEDEEDVRRMFDDSVKMLEDLDVAFRQFDNFTLGSRKSLTMSPRAKDQPEVLAPSLLAALLGQQLWLSRDDVDETFNSILEKLLSLSYANSSKAEENILMGKLTLHGVYGQFRTDMFTSSITESTIAIPMGMGSKEPVRPAMPSSEILDALANAQNYFSSYLKATSAKGNVVKVREAAISLALIGAFRTSLGDKKCAGPGPMAILLDAAAALTLRIDMLDAISQKIQAQQYLDDMQWPILSEDGMKVVRAAKASKSKFSPIALVDSDDEDDERAADHVLRSYWDSIRQRYQSNILGSSPPTSAETVGLPENWVIVNVTVTPDKDTLFVSRQQGGSEPNDPLIFCIPLKGRRDHAGDEEEGHLTFDGALDELRDIIRSSDECTKQAVNIRPDDDEARSNWWKQRGQLDTRMRELLENIEYCWLGAFKTILSPRTNLSQDTISDLRSQFERVFHRCLHVKENKKAKSRSNHKKSSSQPQPNSPTQFSIDDTLIERFSTLSPKSRDEELEDLVYFVLDLYQFHGVPVAIAEVDIDQVVIDIRSILEEHSGKMNRLAKTAAGSSLTAQRDDEHVFLVLDKNVQGLPWESMPILRGRSVSRIPGIQFLHDRLAFAAKVKHPSNPSSGASGKPYNPQTGAIVDARKGFFVLNPSGDLSRTEERFKEWSEGMKSVGWDGVVGRPITEQEFVGALKSRDLVVYFGHGGGEQYVRSHRIRSLPSCAATMLWGCSSGALREMGEFDRTGTPYNYMLAGCPSLVANLWDVTDKDIDKLSQAVFDKLGLNAAELTSSKTYSTGTTTTKNKKEGETRKPTSIVAAVSQSRDSCKLKYLTGAAPVVYGIPFYL